jgi:para-aminobenzoate synthetase/4-amino-4-deoxychorismate lyase
LKFLVKAEESNQYYYCDLPEVVIVANDAAELLAAMQRIEVLQNDGYYVAGWLSYAAGAALNPRQAVVPDQSFPLLTMLASRDVKTISLEDCAPVSIQKFEARIDKTTYESQYQKLIDYILAGDLYQANFSFRANVGPVNDPYALFCQLEREHPVPYAAYIETEEWQVVSLSPELFLKQQGRELISEPMKGTIERGLSYAEDEALRRSLEKDEKNCAENLMIVDLMRNDLGRICETGSVAVPELFTAKHFHSLHQLISKVTGRLREKMSLEDILGATYPAGSITGAPKVRAMEVVAELEQDGRKAYTGSVGLFLPGGDFFLNVAIRTLTCQRQLPGAPAELGIGSGVVANSSGPEEWQECLLKSDFLRYRQRHTEVFETMLWRQDYLWLAEHLTRLEQSCGYFLIRFDLPSVRSKLDQLAKTFDEGRYRVRLAVDAAGKIHVRSSKLETEGWGKTQLKLCVSTDRVNSKDRYQFHKTDHRPLYGPGFEAARAAGFDEVLYLNEQGALAEGAISNVFVRIGASWLTPPESAGLLAGIWRANQLQSLNAAEENIMLETLQSAEEILLGNSLRLGCNVGEIWFNDALIWPTKGEG